MASPKQPFRMLARYCWLIGDVTLHVTKAGSISLEALSFARQSAVQSPGRPEFRTRSHAVKYAVNVALHDGFWMQLAATVSQSSALATKDALRRRRSEAVRTSMTLNHMVEPYSLVDPGRRRQCTCFQTITYRRLPNERGVRSSTLSCTKRAAIRLHFL